MISQRPHWWFFVRQILAFTVVTALWISVAVLSGSLKSTGWAAGIGMALLTPFVLWRLLLWSTTHFEIDGGYVRRRYVSRTLAFASSEVAISELLGIDINAGSPFEMWFGSGDLRLTTANQTAFVFPDINRVEWVADVLKRVRDGQPVDDLFEAVGEDVDPVVVDGLVPDLDGVGPVPFEAAPVMSTVVKLKAGLQASLVVMITGSCVSMFVMPDGPLAFKVGILSVISGVFTAGFAVVRWF